MNGPRWVLFAAAALQVALVTALPLGHGSIAAGFVLAIGLVGLFVARHHMPACVGTMLLTTACLGGGGMYVGSLIDFATAAPVPPCHAAAGAETSVFNWMTGLMLLGCVPGCWWFCPRRSSWRADLCMHGGSALCMWVGMYAGGRVLGSALAPALGHLSGMHLAMLAGMLVGVGSFALVYPSWFPRSSCASESPQPPRAPDSYESGSAASR